MQARPAVCVSSDHDFCRIRLDPAAKTDSFCQNSYALRDFEVSLSEGVSAFAQTRSPQHRPSFNCALLSCLEKAILFRDYNNEIRKFWPQIALTLLTLYVSAVIATSREYIITDFE
jgi:hypothetical protein